MAMMCSRTNGKAGVVLAEGQPEPSVLRIGGVRHVAPYWISVELRLGRHRRRMRGKERPDVDEARTTVGEELRAISEGGKHTFPTAVWWANELRAGRVFPDSARKGEPVREDQLGGGGDDDDVVVLHGRFHYHEQAVPDVAPRIVYEDGRYVVVNKPAGIDVLHNPAAGWVRNSLPGLLLATAAADPTGALVEGEEALKPAHRLDAPVSGLVCCGRTDSDAKRLSRRNELVKLYLARVLVPEEGLPPLPHTIEAPVGFDASHSLAYVDATGGGKQAKTVVTECRGVLDDGTAIVVMRIFTGRKHQTRLHLQTANMPIANDERYGGLVKSDPLTAFATPNPPPNLKDLYNSNYVAGCEYCQFARDVLAGRRGNGPRVSVGIWLHCWKYAFPTLGLSFESPIPQWAGE